MFSFTSQEYKKTYKSRLSVYLDEYEDNNPHLFIEDELKIYNALHNELKFIVYNFDKNFEEEIKEGPNKHLYLSIINSYIKTQHKFKPIPKPSIPQSVLNYVIQSISNTKPKTISNDKNIPIPQYSKEDLNKMLKESWDSECNEDYIKSNMKKIYNNIITSTKRIIDFLNDEKTKLQKSNTPENIIDFKDDSTYGNPKNKINPYLQVFSSPEAYQLFEKLHETYKDTKTPIADYSFIYRMMYDEGYILDSFRPQMFINWLSKHYEIELTKIKTIDKCSPDSKLQNYNTLKELLQIK